MLSFPGYWHLAPRFTRECRWLSVSRRCAGLHGRLQAVSAPQRSRSTVGFPSAGLSGEASQPGVRHACRHAPAEPGPDASENGVASSPNPQGRHRTSRSRSFALRHGSCLLPLKLRFRSQPGDPVFSTPPELGSYRCSAPAFPVGEGGATKRSIRDGPFPFRVPVAKPVPSGGTFLVRNRQEQVHHTGSQ